MPLSKPNIENLESLLNRIWYGELDHNQTTYFCGTSACLAGWDYILSKETNKDPQYYLVEDNVWNFSRKNNNLTAGESVLFFDYAATKSLHKTALQFLKDGNRLEGMVRIFVSEIPMRQSYEFGEVNLWFYLKKDYEKFEPYLSKEVKGVWQW